MAFPTIPTSAAGRIVSSPNTNPAGTHTFPNLNTLTAPAGDLIIAIVIIYDGNSTNAEFSSWGGSFNEFVDQATTTTMGIGAAYKWSSGSETGTFTVTSADASANDSVCILLAIPGAHASTPPEGGTIANGTSSAANINALNPTGWDAEDTLWIAVCGSGETSTTGSFTAPSAAPTNYGNLFVTAVTEDVVGGVYGAVAFRQLNAASDDPATFTVDTSNARNSALLIAVRPAAVIALVIAEASHGHAVDNLALTQTHQLVVADTAHGHAADAMVLTQVHALAVADAAHGHASDNVTLEAGSVNLVIADVTQTHAADGLALTQAHGLAVADAGQTHAADALTLTQVHNLQQADSAQAHMADSLTLTQVHQLAIQDAAHAQSADECQVNSATQLVIADATHAHITDGLVLTQVHELLLDSAAHGYTTDVLALTQAHNLAAADATHGHDAENLDLSSSDEIDLAIQDALHQHTADTTKLTTHLVPAPKVTTRASATVHVGATTQPSSLPSARPRVTQRSSAA